MIKYSVYRLIGTGIAFFKHDLRSIVFFLLIFAYRVFPINHKYTIIIVSTKFYRSKYVEHFKTLFL